MEQTLGKYTLLKKLATGGMAEVWLARHAGIEGFKRHLVIKRILPHLADAPDFVEMFLNEARIAAQFNHPNIAQIHELGEDKGTYYIAMEFVRGEDLGRIMRKAWSVQQWIAYPISLRIIALACEGLYYAHNRTDESGRALKVVHRDISPQNILIGFDGSVKLVDFGIAKAADSASVTRTGAPKGKCEYMSPEQASGKSIDHRADIFALGLTLYELLTGARPLKRDTYIATLDAAKECNIPPPSQVADVPAQLDAIVMKAVAKNPDDRYDDARQFGMALEEFLVKQQWIAGSPQISELATTLFADRLSEEAREGGPVPGTAPGSPTVGTKSPPAVVADRSKPEPPLKSDTPAEPRTGKVAPPKNAKGGGKKRAKAGVVGAVVAVAFVGIIVVATRSQDFGGAKGDPVFVKVETNIDVAILVRHHADEKRREPIEELGHGRGLQKLAGAHLRDTILLKNDQLGAYWEQELPFGTPGTTLPIIKEFKQGKLKLTVVPRRGVGSLVVVRQGDIVGQYDPEQRVQIELYEGEQQLQLQGPQLEKPVDFTVVIEPGTENVKAVDVSKALLKVLP